MRKWILKAIVQKTISFLPYKNNINLLFQKYVTKGLALNDEHFGYKIQHATDHINYALQYKKTIKLDCLELGTGWYPIVPIALFLSGANQIHTIDLSSHLTRDSIKDTLDKYLEWHSKGKLTDLMALAIPEKWQQLIETHQKIEQLDRDDLLKIFKINPIVGDARQINFEDNSIDFICSNNTFEHIYKEVLEGILKEFHRVVKKKGGLMSHFIDMSDHFAHYDQSINIYNFLQFSPSAWNRIDNSIQFNSASKSPSF